MRDDALWGEEEEVKEKWDEKEEEVDSDGKAD